jgi:GcrA cell cycle regulator
MPINNVKWPDERVTQLRSFLDSGMSAAQVADALCNDGFLTTRNAVIGKAHRINQVLHGAPPVRRWTEKADAIVLANWQAYAYPRIREMLAEAGIHFSASSIRDRVFKLTSLKKGKGAPGRSRKSVNNRGPAGLGRTARVYEPPPLPPDVRMVGLLDLGSHDCHYPIGDPKQSGFGYCGAPKMATGQYCRWHHRIMYQPDSAMRASHQRGLARFSVALTFVSGMAL